MQLQVKSGIDRFLHGIEAVSEWSGRLSAWLVFAMVALISYDVFMRYVFNSTHVALQELEWHLFALTFLLGAAYTFKHDGHVRVDIVYQSWMTPKHRAWVDLLGGLFILVPFCVLILYTSWPFVYNAFVQGEGSPDPGGLPYRWVLKAAIPAGFALLLLQGVADIVRSFWFIFNAEQPSE